MQKAEEDDFHTFVAARMDRWRRSAFLMCQDWHMADDLVSITVTKLFRNWRKVNRADNPDAYAQRVLSRSWLTERRRPWRRERLPDGLPEPRWSPPDRADDRESLAELLRSLGPRQRAVLVLRFYLDYSVEETARIMQVSPGTVKSQSARGLVALRALSASIRN
ncbi:SigE family RNA polymerase sigma factor [Plantactinospora soyae]|uniref:RNA polymerase sigma-70 factor (Sigma-E family) n=1 Tax=Plantactinospora soyae TaxID=1544732 RepID=A0A927MBT0_9ACTN|nr:SigE family RNA polymerase sigma factor [Plantactinospora soyae]MBE1491838.1 RNA polymerase sigma-70 factor (sigma-E family) [Plantactinospora soyae]